MVMNDGAILELSQVNVCGMRGNLSSERREQAVVQRRVRGRRLGLAPYILPVSYTHLTLPTMIGV